MNFVRHLMDTNMLFTLPIFREVLLPYIIAFCVTILSIWLIVLITLYIIVLKNQRGDTDGELC